MLPNKIENALGFRRRQLLRRGSFQHDCARGKSKRELSRFLITRGLWLIVLEVTVVRLLVTFSLDPKLLFFLQVIWVIGLSMIVLAALIHLPLKVLAGLGLATIALHNLLDRFPAQPWRGPGTPVRPTTSRRSGPTTSCGVRRNGRPPASGGPSCKPGTGLGSAG